MFKCFIALCTSKKSRRSSSSGGESLFLKGKKRARKSCAFCGKQHMNALSTFFSILISRQAQSCLNTVNKFNFIEKNVLLKIRTIHSRVEYRPFLGLRERPLNDVQFQGRQVQNDGRYKVKIPHTYKAIKGKFMQTSFSKKCSQLKISLFNFHCRQSGHFLAARSCVPYKNIDFMPCQIAIRNVQSSM